MRKGSALMGKVIVTYDTGEQIGTVADLLFDLGNNQLLSVIISENEGLPSSPVVRLDHVQALGADAVIIASRAQVQPLDTMPESHLRLQRDLRRVPLLVFTTDGRALGTLVDVYVDEHTGAVQGYEVSGGAFAAESFGISFVPSSQDVRVGTSVVMVPAETATLMLEHVEESTTVPVAEHGEAESGARQFLEAAQLPAQKPQTVEETRGRRVRCAVQTDDGLIIAAQGQIVTEAIIESARTHHREQALQDAVYQTTLPHRVGEEAMSLLSRSRDRVREKAAHLVTGSERVWDQVKGTVTHLVHRGKHHNDQSESGGNSTDVTSTGDERTHAHHDDHRRP